LLSSINQSINQTNGPSIVRSINQSIEGSHYDHQFFHRKSPTSKLKQTAAVSMRLLNLSSRNLFFKVTERRKKEKLPSRMENCKDLEEVLPNLLGYWREEMNSEDKHGFSGKKSRILNKSVGFNHYSESCFSAGSCRMRKYLSCRSPGCLALE
jgi:hypothetical protein